MDYKGLKIQENVLLKDYTTFHIGGPARYFVILSSTSELDAVTDFAKKKRLSRFVLGGGSNILVSDNGFDGIVLHPKLKGREVLMENDESIILKIASGENLDETIAWVVKNGWCGMENLSFVPGDIGGLAIQNVNCYGHHASDIIESVEMYDLVSGQKKNISNEECEFGYRKSIFNTNQRGKYLVLSVNVKLSKKCKLVLTYPDVVSWFKDRDTSSISLQDVRNALIQIRTGKGQDTSEHWSAGSFFKNLLLSDSEFESLRAKVLENFGVKRVQELQDMRDRFSVDSEIKIPIAWVLDQLLNLKGESVGDAMISEKHVINIVNSGNASAKDVLILFKKVRQLVYDKTGTKVVNEPELVGFSEQELSGYFELK